MRDPSSPAFLRDKLFSAVNTLLTGADIPTHSFYDNWLSKNAYNLIKLNIPFKCNLPVSDIPLYLYHTIQVSYTPVTKKDNENLALLKAVTLETIASSIENLRSHEYCVYTDGSVGVKRLLLDGLQQHVGFIEIIFAHRLSVSG